MAKILLINPPLYNFTGVKTAHTPPLGLMYLAGVLEKASHQAHILDAEALMLSWKDLEKKIASYKPDIIGIGAVSIALPALVQTANIAKKVLPKIQIIAGGPGPTFEAKRVLKENKNIDVVVMYEGEKTILDLLDWYQGNRKLPEIKGIAYKAGDKIEITAAQEYIADLDSLPFPAYHLLEPGFPAYGGLHGNYPEMDMPNTVIMASRGCVHRCTFCSNNQVRNRWRTPQNIVDEVEFVTSKIGAKSVQFYDDEFIGMNSRQNDWVKDICDELIKRELHNIGYLAQARCSKFVNLATMEKMRQAGFKWLWWGVESGSQAVLDRICKDTTVEDIKKSIKIAKQAGLKSLMFLMVGLPGETKQDAILTGRLVEQIKPEKVRFHITTPFPGSQLWNELHEKNQIEDYNLLHYNTRFKAVHHTDNMTAQDIEDMYRMLLFKYETSRWNLAKVLIRSIFIPKEMMKLPKRLKMIFSYLPKWLKINLGKQS